MSGSQVFRFHIGPVQGFIAQARRTRDLWAGSFLLSWLAAHAMVAVRAQSFDIDFPNVTNDNLISAIENDGKGAPLLATVPNQFMASGDNSGFDPDKVTQAVRDHWQQVSDAVYAEFVAPVVAKTLGNGTKKIWDDQIAGFWEMYWVLGPRESGGKEGAWLDERKNWRSHRMPDQGGEHCILMGEWQEISGHGRGKDSRKNHEDFWEAMRTQDASGAADDNRLDLREGERLCAIALVKRFFPRLSVDMLTEAIGWVPGGNRDVIRYWHSTGHIAAARWLADVEKHPAVVSACDGLADYVRGALHARHFGEQRPRIRCLCEGKWARYNRKPNFAELDSNFLRADDIVNARSLPLYDKSNKLLDDDKRIDRDSRMIPERKRLRELLGEVKAAIKQHNETATDASRIKFEEPPPYYAMLLMDGDRVGKLLNGEQDAAVSNALAEFTGKVALRFGVPNGRADFDGVLIYAGGDDVLALMTVEDAISAAMQLAEDYRDAFKANKVRTPDGGDPDISAAIVLADHHEPFRDVSQYAHDLLEKVAKDGNGRASLAIDVRKPSGQAAEWVGKWRHNDVMRPPELLLKLAKERAYSNRFPYSLRTRYIAPAERKFADIGFSDDDVAAIFAHEIGKSREAGGGSKVKKPDNNLVSEMLVLSRSRLKRPKAGIDEAGLLVVRFLDQYGIM